MGDTEHHINQGGKTTATQLKSFLRAQKSRSGPVFTSLLIQNQTTEESRKQTTRERLNDQSTALSSAQCCLAPSSGDDGCTTIPATREQIGRRRGSAPLQSVAIQAVATPPSTRGIGAPRDPAQSGAPPDASLVLCSSRPDDNMAMEALHGQTIDSMGRSPESCTGHRDWYEYCQETGDREPLDGSRRLKSKSTSHTKRPKNKKPPPKGWLNNVH